MPPPVVGLTSPAASPTASDAVGVGAAAPGRAAASSAAAPAIDVAVDRRRASHSDRRNAAKRSPAARLAHQADARVRRAVAAKRHQPRESGRRDVAAEPHFDVGDRSGNGVSSCALCRNTSRHAEPELAVKPVVGAAGQHAGARASTRRRRAATVTRTPMRSDGDRSTRLSSRTSAPARARADREARVERRAIDDRRACTLAAADRDRLPGGAPEARGAGVGRGSASRGRSNSSNASSAEQARAVDGRPTTRALRARTTSMTLRGQHGRR